MKISLAMDAPSHGLPLFITPKSGSFVITSLAMALICISFPSLGFASPSHGTRRRNMAAFQKQPNYKTMAVTSTNAPTVRRSANYPPSQWSYDHLQSLRNNYVGEEYKTTLLDLKEKVRKMISEDTAVEKTLYTVDDLQRLGISYHFKDEISGVLEMIYNRYFEAHEKWKRLDLNLKALGFRLLRQHGYRIPQEIFEDMKLGDTENIDVVGMLNLYEASFFAVEEESILDQVREFTSKFLKKKLENKSVVDQNMSMLISHALELPLLWRIERFEAIWFIEAYRGRRDMKPLLLELAILDFNIVQGIHLEDLKYSSRWWDGLCWDKKLTFARDRLVESFMWAVGANYEPQSASVRRQVTKLVSLVNVIDDVYDIYGTLDELEQFTDIVRRWDINAVEVLPDYMKICFVGFYNTINEMAYNTLTIRELFVIPSVKKAWADYCEANFVEARWFNSGYTPTLEEYLDNSRITISLPVIVSSALYFASSEIMDDTLQNVIHWSSIILRLADDLGTSSAEIERGDVPKSIHCYMHETGASEEEARAYIKNLILETWKKLNKERMASNSPYSSIFIECAINLGRMAQFTYQTSEDMFGSPDDLHISHQTSLLFNPKS